MSESQELYASVNYIRHKVDAIERIEFLNLRSNKELKAEYTSLLKEDELLLRVYKTIDGVKSQREIAETLEKSETTISRRINILEKHGLIEIKDIGKNGKKIYKYSVAEKAFKLSTI